MDPRHAPPQDQFIQDQDAADSGGDDEDDSDKPKDKKAGRRKIKIEFIQDKSRRHITFSKRKAGIMKKAYELSTLTGTQVLLLVVSETGLVYTFTTAKLQPLVTQPEGKNLIQACLNAPHGSLPSSMPQGQTLSRATVQPMSAPPTNVPGGLSIGASSKDEQVDDDEDDVRTGSKRRRRSSTSGSSRATRAQAPGSPQSPAMPQNLAIPVGQSTGVSGGGGSSSQPPPTSPHYTHASPSGPYHHGAGQGAAGGEIYGQSMSMAPPPGGYYQHGSSQQWSTVSGSGAPHYGRR